MAAFAFPGKTGKEPGPWQTRRTPPIGWKRTDFSGSSTSRRRTRFPGKALIAFSGSDGGLELTRALAGVFQARGLTTLALAYVGEEGLPQGFSGIPIEYVEAAAKRLHGMGYGKVGLWASPRGRSWL